MNRIRVLLAKPGLDGHDRGVRVVAKALRDAGMEVIYTGLHQSVHSIVQSAVQEDVDVIGLSILSGAHVPLLRQLMDELRSADALDKAVVVGGTIPPEDAAELESMGVNRVFPVGSPISKIAGQIEKILVERGKRDE